MTAPGSSYPVELLDKHGKPVLPQAKTLQFTDSTDQPGSGSGTPLSVTDGSTTVKPCDAIDFTSGATVTASGTTAQVAVNGGGSVPTARLTFNAGSPLTTPNPAQTVSTGNLDGNSLAGQLVNVLTLPPQVFGSGTVIAADSLVAVLAGVIPSAADALDIKTTILVTDAAGTNIASIDVTATLPNPVTDLAYTVDWTGATWTIVAGMDLSGMMTTLASAAGGTYILAASIGASWD